MGEKKRHKTLDELNIMDDFLFHEIITDHQYGKEFIYYFLKTVLNQEVMIKNISGQVIGTSGDTDKRAIRMDVVTEGSLDEDQKNSYYETITDIEMQAQKKGTDEYGNHNLRRRSRFYQSMLDVNMLNTGQPFGELPNVIIIICAPFDIFGRNRIKYTFENVCMEEPDLKLKDGAKRIFLYTKGEMGATEELKEMLLYIQDSRQENVTSKEMENIHKIVTMVKQTKERRERYMWAFEREQMIREEGWEEGREEGEKRVNCLIKILTEKSRLDEISKAASDREYQKKLFNEFGI